MELVTGIPPGTSIKLKSYLFDHLEFLELSFSVGDTAATVRTKKPLDADILKNVSYSPSPLGIETFRKHQISLT